MDSNWLWMILEAKLQKYVWYLWFSKKLDRKSEKLLIYVINWDWREINKKVQGKNKIDNSNRIFKQWSCLMQIEARSSLL